jgi:hypothetical protein
MSKEAKLWATGAGEGGHEGRRMRAHHPEEKRRDVLLNLPPVLDDPGVQFPEF